MTLPQLYSRLQQAWLSQKLVVTLVPIVFGIKLTIFIDSAHEPGPTPSVAFSSLSADRGGWTI